MLLVIFTKKLAMKRKFNVVLSGLPKCPPGTKMFERDHADLKSATAVLTKVDGSIQPFSIRDTVRLGKFNPIGRPTAMLVTLNRSTDVTSILSKRAKIKHLMLSNLISHVNPEQLNCTCSKLVDPCYKTIHQNLILRFVEINCL